MAFASSAGACNKKVIRAEKAENQKLTSDSEQAEEVLRKEQM